MPRRRVLILVVALTCASLVHAEVVIETEPIGNPGNDGELSGVGVGGSGSDRISGAVDYIYNIGKYEVTAGQYVEFLNAVATTDNYGLYHIDMDYTVGGCQITQHGTRGFYTYDFSGRPSGTEADWVDRPVNFVSWGDAARFANWLHNGQPTGAQDLTTTEDGSYYLDGALNSEDLLAVIREDDATWVIPTEDEWYKAAYHYNDGVTGNYFDYPTSSDSGPSPDLVDPDPGNNATFARDSIHYTIGRPYFRTAIGDHENSESPYGTFDQGGNLKEWNETVYSLVYRGIRGGEFGLELECLRAANRHGANPAYKNGTIGFRVAEVPRSKSDIDFDGDVDLHDYDLFQNADLHDYALLQAAFTGPQ